jgi:predicted DNA-binding transcriptional regulator YafY
MKKEEFTIHELKVLYKLAKEYEDAAPESEEEQYNDYYDEYEKPISKKTVNSILKKIAKNLPQDDTGEIDKDFLRRKYPTYNNYINDRVYSTLKKALGQLKTTQIEYFNMDSSEFSKRNIDVYYTSSKYTIGYCHLRKAIRKFRTSRIAKTKITDSKYSVPKGFNKNDY